MADIGSLRPRLLIHGHTTLTEQFTAEAVPGLQAALTQLHGQVLDGIRDGRTLPDILQEASLPAVLREHPTAVVPCPADHPAGPAPPPASTTLAGTRWRRRAQQRRPRCTTILPRSRMRQAMTRQARGCESARRRIP